MVSVHRGVGVGEPSCSTHNKQQAGQDRSVTNRRHDKNMPEMTMHCHGLPSEHALPSLPLSLLKTIQNLNPFMDSLGQTLMVELSLIKLA